MAASLDTDQTARDMAASALALTLANTDANQQGAVGPFEGAEIPGGEPGGDAAGTPTSTPGPTTRPTPTSGPSTQINTSVLYLTTPQRIAANTITRIGVG